MSGRSMIGRRIGRYEITGQIGRGGMGIVYLAKQTSLNRSVAVKMLPYQLADSPEFLSRFQREAETLARMNHENIVHIYDVEEDQGNHFIIMEYVPGPSLAQLLRRETLPVAAVRDIAAALASGLAQAHRQGVIHRDIKPDNVLFTMAGQPKLTDFGIAHTEDARLRTQTGAMIGTPYYVAPEQARGERVTEASDLYSLGVVLFEMLAGRRPFEAENQVLVFVKHLEEAPPSVSAIAKSHRNESEVALIQSSGLESLVEQLLSKSPSARPASADSLAQTLRSFELAAQPGQAIRGFFATLALDAAEGRPPGSNSRPSGSNVAAFSSPAPDAQSSGSNVQSPVFGAEPQVSGARPPEFEAEPPVSAGRSPVSGSRNDGEKGEVERARADSFGADDRDSTVRSGVDLGANFVEHGAGTRGAGVGESSRGTDAGSGAHAAPTSITPAGKRSLAKKRESESAVTALTPPGARPPDALHEAAIGRSASVDADRRSARAVPPPVIRSVRSGADFTSSSPAVGTGTVSAPSTSRRRTIALAGFALLITVLAIFLIRGADLSSTGGNGSDRTDVANETAAEGATHSDRTLDQEDRALSGRGEPSPDGTPESAGAPLVSEPVADPTAARWEIAALIQRFCLALQKSDPEAAFQDVRPEARAQLTDQIEGWLGPGVTIREARASRPRIEVGAEGPADAVFLLDVNGTRGDAPFAKRAEFACKLVRQGSRWWIASARTTEAP